MAARRASAALVAATRAAALIAQRRSINKRETGVKQLWQENNVFRESQ